MPKFGKNLKHLRVSSQLSQIELAELTGFKPSSISHFERGGRNPGLKSLAKLCRGLRCTPNDLIDIEEE